MADILTLTLVTEEVHHIESLSHVLEEFTQ